MYFFCNSCSTALHIDAKVSHVLIVLNTKVNQNQNNLSLYFIVNSAYNVQLIKDTTGLFTC